MTSVSCWSLLVTMTHRNTAWHSRGTSRNSCPQAQKLCGADRPKLQLAQRCEWVRSRIDIERRLSANGTRRVVDYGLVAGAQSTITERGPTAYEDPESEGASFHGTMSAGDSSEVSIHRLQEFPGDSSRSGSSKVSGSQY